MTAKTAQLRTGSLLLDAKNSRIPADRRSDNQRSLLHELLQHEDVRGLASSIARLGLFPNERLIVMPLGRRFIVLEGNRRLAAIRLLLNPELAPTDAQVRFFRGLSTKANLSELSKLEVAILPNRIAAAPVIAALHTGDAKRRWSSLQQARFYRELVDEGQTPAEIAAEVGSTLGGILAYLRAELLHRMALTLDYAPEVQRKIEDARFPLTTLERFLESKTGRKFLGVDFDEEHGLRGIVHPDRFRAVLARVAEDVATTRGLTRKINNEEGFQTYIGAAEGKIASTKRRGSFTPEVILGGGKAPSTTPEEPTPSPRPPRAPKPSSSVIPRGFTCTSPSDRVRAVFEELKAINIQLQRNSTGVMLRVLLELALWSYVEREGHAQAVCDHYDPQQKRRRRNPDWTPSLRATISYAADKRIISGMSAAGYKSVRSLASKDAGYIITVDSFNEFVHNPNFSPTEGDLRALWQRAEPMLEIILT